VPWCGRTVFELKSPARMVALFGDDWKATMRFVR